MPDADDDADFTKMPANLQAVVQNIGFARMEPDAMDQDEEGIYSRMREGKCMTCGTPLEENANFIINRFGIVGGYCSGQCHSDMAVMGWIQEQFDDILSAVKFRGGEGDDASEG